MVTEATSTIMVTDADNRRLSELIGVLLSPGTPYRGQVQELATELARASIVPAANVPDDVVTMNSRVVARELANGDPAGGRTLPLTLVYRPKPGDAGDGGGVSVFSPLGIRLLGARVGDDLEWPLARGRRRHLRIERITYQPEAAGNSDL